MRPINRQTHHQVSVDSLDDTSALHYEQLGAKWFVGYFKFIERYGRFVFAFWIIVFVFSLFYGPKFLSMGDDAVKPPKNTPSWFAQEEFEFRFKEQAQQVPLLVLVRSLTKGVDISSPDLFAFAKQLKANVLEYNATTGDGNVLSILSYYDLAGSLLDSAKDEFVSHDKSATFLNIMVRGDRITYDRYDFVKFLKTELRQLNPDPKLFEMGLTGFDAMAYDSMDDNAKNVEKIDIFTVPIAMGLLGLMIRSWRLLIFSFFNLGCAILSSFAFMALLVNYGGASHPESASAQLMEVITMAVSIDWSLFLHRRYRDELKVGCTPREAAFLALMHSGHVVVMSGATLIVVFIGFITLPAASVQMDGACCAIGVTIAMMIALTNTPAVWLTFPNFCSDFDPRCCKRRTVEELEREAARLGMSDVVTAQAVLNGGTSTRPSAPLIASEDMDNDVTVPLIHKHIHPMYSGPRFKFTKWITRFPNNIFSIILVYVLVIPLAFQVRDIDINQNILDNMPRRSEAANTFKQAFRNFPGGTFAPFYIMVTTKDRTEKEKVLTSHFFDAAKFVSVETLKSCKGLDNRFTDRSVVGPALLSGVPIPFSEAKVFLNTAKSLPCNPLFGRDVAPWWKGPCSVAKSYEFEWTQAVNAEENAMLVTLTVPFFPFAQESQKFIDTVYEVLEVSRAQYKDFDFYLCGVEVGFDALQRRVQSLFPVLLAVTFTIVFTILGVLLRSAFVPIRLALTLVAPLCAVFGFAVLVYQKGALTWTGADAFEQMDGFFWYIPILLLSMIIGLSLDWDVLLVSRIMEHREAGYDIRASICKAVCETGGTISTAGIIMCLAFGGMLFSDQLLINACGFILTTALLLDTFIVNTILVPALISIGDNVAWWPVKMPMTDLKTLDNCDEFPVDPILTK